MKFQQNIGKGDMIIRIVIGLGLLYIGVWDETIMKSELSRTIITIIGVNSFLTGALRYCPTFDLLGMRSKPNHKDDEFEMEDDFDMSEERY